MNQDFVDLLATLDRTGSRYLVVGPQRLEHPIGTLRVPFLGRGDLIRNKRAAGRTKDLADLEALGE